MEKEYPDQLVDQPTLTQRSGSEGGAVKHLAYKLNTRVGDGIHEEAHWVPLMLPEDATDIQVHGPARYKVSQGEKYGVRITFTAPAGKRAKEPGKPTHQSRFVELPEPAFRVELLDREPDERWLSAA